MSRLRHAVRTHWLALIASHHHELRSPLSVDACRERLNTRWVTYFAEGPRGFAIADQVIVLWHRPLRRGPYSPIFTGQLQPRGRGTVLVGRMGVPRVVQLFHLLWFAAIPLFTLGGVAVAAFAAAAGTAPVHEVVATPLTGLALLVGSSAYASIALRWARSDHTRILQVLSDALQAEAPHARSSSEPPDAPCERTPSALPELPSSVAEPPRRRKP